MTKIITLDECKSYATEANLDKALEKLGFVNHFMARAVIKCRNTAGRWTAVFQLDRSQGGYAGVFASAGFMTV